jgi:ABC-type transport system involved in cytochrome c biogenesis ATPase subunit
VTAITVEHLVKRLAGDAQTRIGALSGGQRRRVDLGLGVIGRPEVLFLDEPTTGLDPEARRRIWAVIGEGTCSIGRDLHTPRRRLASAIENASAPRSPSISMAVSINAWRRPPWW